MSILIVPCGEENYIRTFKEGYPPNISVMLCSTTLLHLTNAFSPGSQALGHHHVCRNA